MRWPPAADSARIETEAGSRWPSASSDPVVVGFRRMMAGTLTICRCQVYDADVDSSQVRVTASGQVSLPAALRRRWGAAKVLVIDKGDYAIVRPVPTDPIGALQGAHRGEGPTSEEARAAERAEW